MRPRTLPRAASATARPTKAPRLAGEGGECFARRHDRNLREGLSVPLQLQLIEAEQLPFYLARWLAR